MSIAIGDAGTAVPAVHAGASSAVAPVSPVSPVSQPSSPVAAALTPLLVGWLMVSTLLARRFGLFRRQTIVGPERIGGDESPWLPVFLFFTSFALAGFFGPLISQSMHLTADRKTFVEFHLSRGLLIVLVVAGMHAFRNRGLAMLGLTRSGLFRGIVGGLILIFAMFPVVSVVSELTSLSLHWFGRPQPAPHQVLQALRDNGADHVLIGLLLTAAVVTAPVSEELIFRGCLQTAFAYGFEWLWAMLRLKPPLPPTVRVEEHMTPGSTEVLTFASPNVAAAATLQPGIAARWCAIFVAASLFAAAHGVWAFVPPLFVLAVGLGIVYEMTGNLWVTIVAHATFNAAQILIFHAVG